jgi:Carboxyl transferase domain
VAHIRAWLHGIQAATGEDVSAEELGGAELHCSTSGVADYLAESEEHAISLARSAIANLHHAPVPPPADPDLHSTWEEPLHPPDELRGVSLPGPAFCLGPVSCSHVSQVDPCELEMGRPLRCNREGI